MQEYIKEPKKNVYDWFQEMFYLFVSGITLAFMFLFIMIATMGAWTSLLQAHPEWALKTFCISYLNK